MELEPVKKIGEFIFTDLLPVSTKIDNQVNLFELGLDSLRMMRLIHFLEETFNITIRDEDIKADNISTLDKIVKLTQYYLEE